MKGQLSSLSYPVSHLSTHVCSQSGASRKLNFLPNKEMYALICFLVFWSNVISGRPSNWAFLIRHLAFRSPKQRGRGVPLDALDGLFDNLGKCGVCVHLHQTSGSLKLQWFSNWRPYRFNHLIVKSRRRASFRYTSPSPQHAGSIFGIIQLSVIVMSYTVWKLRISGMSSNVNHMVE
jgi:hypothetical protein